jgi:PhoPQ-activated pathogenicity-related protein
MARMKRSFLRLPAAMLLGLACSCLVSRAEPDALEAYVRAADTNFSWRVVGQSNLPNATATQLELTSQQWRGITWTHSMIIVRPAKVRQPDIAFLLISGDGSGRGSVELLRTLADRAGAVAAVVTRVPNQPLFDGRKEDAIIAYTFDQFLKTGDTTWPVLFPMAKSAVRAMDAVQEWSVREHGAKIDRWVVGGASKRGWTTWLTAAVDPRVKGIAPMVIDMLNMPAQTAWASKVYGKQSEKIRDYTELGLIEKMGQPAMQQLRNWVDPFSYRQRYSMPKLILLGTNDPYWTVDSLRHYWEELPGPKLVFQTPNAGHDLGGGRQATQTLAAFYEMIASGGELPKMEWKRGAGELTVRANPRPRSARLWVAESKDRDFRDEVWSSRELPLPAGDGPLVVPLSAPERGYRACLVETRETAPDGRDYLLSTEVCVTPDSIQP